MDDYIALHTYDYKLAFCQAQTTSRNMQRCIWKNLIHTNRKIVSVRGRPGESNKIRASHPNDSESWSENGEKNGRTRQFLKSVNQDQLLYR